MASKKASTKKRARTPAPVKGPPLVRVRYHKGFGPGNQVGVEVDVPESEAQSLVDSGAAVLASPPPAKAPAPAPVKPKKGTKKR